MKRKNAILLALALFVPLVGCGTDSHIEVGDSQEFQLSAPENLAGIASLTSITLTWDEVESAEHYVIFYGKTEGMEGTGAEPANSGEVLTAGTSQKISHLLEGVTYHFAVVAKGSQGIASEKSDPTVIRCLHRSEVQNDDEDPAGQA